MYIRCLHLLLFALLLLLFFFICFFFYFASFPLLRCSLRLTISLIYIYTSATNICAIFKLTLSHSLTSATGPSTPFFLYRHSFFIRLLAAKFFCFSFHFQSANVCIYSYYAMLDIVVRYALLKLQNLYI